MPQAEADQVSFYIYEETSWGALSTALAMSAVPITAINIGGHKDTSESETIRSDRMTDNVFQVGSRAAGSIDFEFQYENTFDKLLEAACGSAWSANVLTQGTTKKSYSGEIKFGDITQYVSTRGLRVEEFRLSGTHGKIVTGSVLFSGKSAAAAGTSIAASVAAYAANQPYVVGLDVGSLKEGGSTLTTVVKSFSIAIRSNPRQVVGVGAGNAPAGINLGRLGVTGTIEAYFEDLTLLNKFLNHTKTSFELTMTTSGGGKSYNFLFPAIYYTGDTPPVTGRNTDVMLPLAFTGVRDTATGNQIKITRVPT